MTDSGSTGSRTIVITGMGAIATTGTGVPALWSAAVAGRTAGQWFEDGGIPGLKLAVCSAPAVTEFPERFRQLRHLDRSAHLAWVAAQEAAQQAGLATATISPERLGVIVGTSRGPVGQWATATEQFARGRVRPTAATHGTISSLSGALALALQAHGPNFTLSAACASGAVAIAQAAGQLLLGYADVMIAGGAEAPLQPALLAQLSASGILGYDADPQRTCRPFDRSRNGTIIGEGAGFLVLETLAHARQRGAKPLASLSSWALGTDAHGRAVGDTTGEGLARVIREALQRSRVKADELGYVNLHGTGTVLNDRLEAAALARLGPAALAVPASSTKPVTGHCLGATSALEVILSVEALRHGQLPPQANCTEPDPDCTVNLVRQPGASAPVQHALSLSSGFWSHHAALVVSRA